MPTVAPPQTFIVAPPSGLRAANPPSWRDADGNLWHPGDVTPQGYIVSDRGDLISGGIVWIAADRLEGAARHGWRFIGARAEGLAQVERHA